MQNCDASLCHSVLVWRTHRMRCSRSTPARLPPCHDDRRAESSLHCIMSTPTRPKSPTVPSARAETARQALLDELRRGKATARTLGMAVGLREKVLPHLEIRANLDRPRRTSGTRFILCPLSNLRRYGSSAPWRRHGDRHRGARRGARHEGWALPALRDRASRMLLPRWRPLGGRQFRSDGYVGANRKKRPVADLHREQHASRTVDVPCSCPLCVAGEAGTLATTGMACAGTGDSGACVTLRRRAR